MRLTGIKPGDVVRVDDGLPYMAFVSEKVPRGLVVTAIARDRFKRTVKAGQVTGHWRKAGR